MWLVLVHAAAVWFMTGVIWTMQVLNYPLLARVGADSFTGYEQAQLGPHRRLDCARCPRPLDARPDTVTGRRSACRATRLGVTILPRGPDVLR